MLSGRRDSEKAMREVREMEERGLACLRLHAAKYVEALLPPSEPGSSQPCVPSAVRDFCEEAVKDPLQQEQMALLSDPTAVRCCPPLPPPSCCRRPAADSAVAYVDLASVQMLGMKVCVHS